MTATINASTSAGVVTTADTSGILQLQTNGTAALTVDASQNTTLAGTLTTTGITNSGVATATRFNPTGSSATGNGMYLPAANSVGISTNGTNAVTVNASQQVGIGVTPNHTSGKAIEIGNAGNGLINFAASENHLTTNAYYNSGWKFGGTGYAQKLTTESGSYQFFVSTASGTAGNAVTFSNLANIDVNSLYTYVGVNPSSNGAGNARIFNSSSGSGTVTLFVGNQAITTSSDVRLKENIVNTQRNALKLLEQLRVVDHTWNDPSDQCENNRNSRGTWMGLIAQEAQPVIPWLVNKPTADVDEKGDPQYWHMDYGYSVPLLVKAIQELKAIVDAQGAEIAALKGATA